MDFELDEDQLALQAAAAEVLAKACPPSYVRAVVEEGRSPDDLWKELCGLDWPGIALPTELGGLGASAVDLAVVLEQLGRVADPTPFLATTTQFAPLVLACGDEEQQERFLTAVVREGHAGTLALAGRDGRWDVAAPAVRAERTSDGWSLSGTATFVVDGARVTEIAVLAATPEGAQAFVVPAESVAARRTSSFDASLHVAQVTFDGAVVGEDRHLVARPAEQGAARTLEQAFVGLAAVGVGACQRVLDMVVEYVGGREQFGVPIGSFQAVKHKVVDMYVAVERARALTYFAALTIAEDDPRRSVACSMAKAAAAEAQQLVFKHAIQLYGGIGFTWENDMQLYVKRAKATALLLGGAAEHRSRVARAVLAGEGVGA